MRILTDGVTRKEIRYTPHDGVVQVKTTQPSTDLISADNERVRNEGGARPLSFGQCQLRIPHNELEALCRINPDLRSPDRDIKTRAWQKFARSTESRPWRVTANGKITS